MLSSLLCYFHAALTEPLVYLLLSLNSVFSKFLTITARKGFHAELVFSWYKSPYEKGSKPASYVVFCTAVALFRFNIDCWIPGWCVKPASTIALYKLNEGSVFVLTPKNYFTNSLLRIVLAILKVYQFIITFPTFVAQHNVTLDEGCLRNWGFEQYAGTG